MTQYIAAVLVCIVAVEAFMRLPLGRALHDLNALLSKILSVITSKRISDHWKEKVLLRYAGQLAVRTLILAGIFVSAGVVIYIAAIITDFLISPRDETVIFLVSLPGIITATVASTVYYLIRR